jgi:hypothetical protein
MPEPESDGPGGCQMARAADSLPAPVSQAAGAPAVTASQAVPEQLECHHGIRAISTNCVTVSQSDNCL